MGSSVRRLGGERATGFEPATSSLGSWHSTPELRPRGCCYITYTIGLAVVARGHTGGNKSYTPQRLQATPQLSNVLLEAVLHRVSPRPYLPEMPVHPAHHRLPTVPHLFRCSIDACPAVARRHRFIVDRRGRTDRSPPCPQ